MFMLQSFGEQRHEMLCVALLAHSRAGNGDGLRVGWLVEEAEAANEGRHIGVR